MDLQIRIKEPSAGYLRGLASATDRTAAAIVRDAVEAVLAEHACQDRAGRVLRALGYRSPRKGAEVAP